MNEAWCAQCGDPYEPVEYVTVDHEGGNFCSAECEEERVNEDEINDTYVMGFRGGAPAIV